jgi:hypothetical protein
VDRDPLVVAGLLNGPVGIAQHPVEWLPQHRHQLVVAQSVPGPIALPQFIWTGERVEVPLGPGLEVERYDPMPVGGNRHGKVQPFGVLLGLLKAVFWPLVLSLGLQRPDREAGADLQDIVGAQRLCTPMPAAVAHDLPIGDADLLLDLIPPPAAVVDECWEHEVAASIRFIATLARHAAVSPVVNFVRRTVPRTHDTHRTCGHWSTWTDGAVRPGVGWVAPTGFEPALPP